LCLIQVYGCGLHEIFQTSALDGLTAYQLGLIQPFSLLLHHEDKLIICKNGRSGLFTSVLLVTALRIVGSAFGRLVRRWWIADLLSKIHLLGVKLVDLILGASSGVLLLLLDLKVSDLRLLHHML